MSYVDQVVRQVQTEKEAQSVIAALTEKFATQSARRYLKHEGRLQKRSLRAVFYHTAGNLLRRGRTRRFSY